MTAAGHAEAAALADALAAEPITAVFCSPRRRTRETAEAIAARHGLSVQVTEALDEIDFGDWTGQRFADLDGQPAWDRWNSDRTHTRPPGGESMDEALDRAAAFVDGIREAGTILFVTHCDIIRGLLCRRDKRPLGDLFAFDVPPGAVIPLLDPALEVAA